jgi:hypothetical protein
MILSRISSRRIRGNRVYYVQVPTDWAERMAARDVSRVQLEDVGDKGVLVLNPVSDERMKVIKAERRRAYRRARRTKA